MKVYQEIARLVGVIKTRKNLGCLRARSARKDLIVELGLRVTALAGPKNPDMVVLFRLAESTMCQGKERLVMSVSLPQQGKDTETRHKITLVPSFVEGFTLTIGDNGGVRIQDRLQAIFCKALHKEYNAV